MRKLTNDEIGKLKKNPIFKGLPRRLKDTGCYADIERQLRHSMVSDHKHPTVKSFVRCKRCAPKLVARQDLLKQLGFKSYGQYLAWHQVMTVIIQQSDLTFHGKE